MSQSAFDRAVQEVMDYMPRPATTSAEREATAIVERVLAAIGYETLREALERIEREDHESGSGWMAEIAAEALNE